MTYQDTLKRIIDRLQKRIAECDDAKRHVAAQMLQHELNGVRIALRALEHEDAEARRKVYKREWAKQKYLAQQLKGCADGR